MSASEARTSTRARGQEVVERRRGQGAADRARRRGRARPPGRPRPGCGTRPRRTTRPSRARSGRRARPSTAGARRAAPRPSSGRRSRAAPGASRRAGGPWRSPESVSDPAAGHHVHGRGRRAALLGREAVRRHLELLDRVLRQVGERPAHDVVVVVLPVDRDVAAAPELPGRGDRERCSIFVGSKFGAGALPGSRNASSRKFRPFSGRLSTTPDDTTPPTSELPVATGHGALLHGHRLRRGRRRRGRRPRARGGRPRPRRGRGSSTRSRAPRSRRGTRPARGSPARSGRPSRSWSRGRPRSPCASPPPAPRRAPRRRRRSPGRSRRRSRRPGARARGDDSTGRATTARSLVAGARTGTAMPERDRHEMRLHIVVGCWRRILGDLRGVSLQFDLSALRRSYARANSF